MKLTKRTLHLQTKPVDFTYPIQNETLGKELLKFMHESGGIGLAANQCGLRHRVFVMCVDNNERVFFNPKILEFGEKDALFQEGCLSYPNESVELSRPDMILLEYQTAEGNYLVEYFTNLEARVVQHEVDHLDGITMHDRKNGVLNDKQS